MVIPISLYFTYSTRLAITSNVECLLLNPNCSLQIVSFFPKNLVSLLQINFSKFFEKGVRIDIGR